MAIQKNDRFSCADCGCEFVPNEPFVYRAERQEWVVTCPVCSSDVARHAPQIEESVADVYAFEASLRAVLAKARMNGISDQEIFAALRAEIEWEAEMVHNGRHISVQLIDLGARQVVAARAAIQPPIPFRARAVGE